MAVTSLQAGLLRYYFIIITYFIVFKMYLNRIHVVNIQYLNTFQLCIYYLNKIDVFSSQL